MHKIRAKDVLDAYWDKKLPVDIVDIARKMEVNVSIDDSMDTTISGMVELLNDEFSIRINPNHRVEWLRFVMAHEIGHIALNHLSPGQPRFSDNKGFIQDNDNPLEAEANKFAMELLMPAEAFKLIFSKGLAENLQWLCKTFFVTERAMIYRLQDLGYIAE